MSLTLDLEHAIGYSAGGCIVIGDLSDAHNQVFLRGHDDCITCISLSKSGNYIASGQKGNNSDILIWDFNNHTLLYRLQEHCNGISTLAFSEDELFLSTVGNDQDKKLFIWDLKTGNIVSNTIIPHTIKSICWGGRVLDIKRRPTNEYLFATIGPNSIYLWSLTPSTGSLISEKVILNSYNRNFTCMTFSKDGERLYLGTDSGDLIVVSIKNKTALFGLLASNAGGILSVALTAESGSLEQGSSIWVGGGDGKIIKYEDKIKNLSPIITTQLSGGISALSPSVDGTELLVGTTNGKQYRLETTSLKSILVADNHSSPIVALAFSANVSHLFCTASQDGTIRIWDTGNYTVKMNTSVGKVVPACLLYCDELVIVGLMSGQIRAFHSLTGEALWTIDNAHVNGVTALAMAPNYKFIVSGGNNGDVRVWELKSRSLICHLKEHSARVNSVVVYTDNQHVLSASRDRSFLCWDLQEERRISSHLQRMGGINALALLGNSIVTVGQEKKVSFWNLQEDNPTNVISSQNECTCVSVAPSGKIFATGGVDQMVKVWDKNGNQISTGIGHSAQISAIEFSPDEKQLISVGLDGNIFVWNIYM